MRRNGVESLSMITHLPWVHRRSKRAATESSDNHRRIQRQLEHDGCSKEMGTFDMRWRLIFISGRLMLESEALRVT